ncbi:VCBS domain-containing protein, partial [Ramlibacter solisilvae]
MAVNQAPIIPSVPSPTSPPNAFDGAVTEDAAATLTVTGTIRFDDQNNGDTHVASTAVVSNSLGGSLTASVTTPDPNGANAGVVTWSYNLPNSNTAVQSLAAGQQVTETFNVTITDNGGLSVTQLVTITITGTNDVPVIGGVSTGDVTEDAAVDGLGNLNASGALTITDADQGGSSFIAQASTAGTYGTFTLAANGAWTYVASNAQAAIQQVGAGQAITDSFVAQAADGTAKTVTVTIHGVDDAPQAFPDTASATEDGPAATGNVLTNDFDDTGDTKTVTALTGGSVGVAKAGTYGSLTLNADGSFSYVADNANALALEQTATDSFTYTMQDGGGVPSTSTLTVTITGANDTPVASGTYTHTVTDTAAGDTYAPITGTL